VIDVETAAAVSEGGTVGWSDRLWTALAMQPLFALAIGGIPVFDGIGYLPFAIGSLAIALLLGEVLLRRFGSVVIDPLWVGAITALVIGMIAIGVLHVAGQPTDGSVWILGPIAALVGVGVAVRMTAARRD